MQSSQDPGDLIVLGKRQDITFVNPDLIGSSGKRTKKNREKKQNMHTKEFSRMGAGSKEENQKGKKHTKITFICVCDISKHFFFFKVE